MTDYSTNSIEPSEPVSYADVIPDFKPNSYTKKTVFGKVSTIFGVDTSRRFLEFKYFPNLNGFTYFTIFFILNLKNTT